MEAMGKEKDLDAGLQTPPARQDPRGESSESTAHASDEVTFAHRDYPFHAEHGPPIDNALRSDVMEEDYQHHSNLLWPRIRHHLREPFVSLTTQETLFHRINMWDIDVPWVSVSGLIQSDLLPRVPLTLSTLLPSPPCISAQVNPWYQMEFMGCFIMIIFGDGSVAQVLLSANPNLPPSSQNKGDYQSISWGWGIGVCLGIYVAGGAGGHLNPAVTFCMCLFRKFPWKKWLPYACAQVLGCFCGAAVIYGNYKSAIDQYEGGASIRTVPGYSDTATAGVFNTYPQPFLTKTGQVFSEIIASAVLILCIFALKDDGNLGAGELTPLMIFLGWETGYAINLARDFGPRLFTYMVGYGPEVWRAGDYYFWIPMVCPFIGGTFGGFLYDALIFTGESPINTPWMGWKRVVRPERKGIKEAWTGKAERQV